MLTKNTRRIINDLAATESMLLKSWRDGAMTKIHRAFDEIFEFHPELRAIVWTQFSDDESYTYAYDCINDFHAVLPLKVIEGLSLSCNKPAIINIKNEQCGIIRSDRLEIVFPIIMKHLDDLKSQFDFIKETFNVAFGHPSLVIATRKTFYTQFHEFVDIDVSTKFIESSYD